MASFPGANRFAAKGSVLRARGRVRRTPGAMNRQEAAYADLLEVEKRAGAIHDYRFEAVKLRLADRTYYTADFLVLGAAGEVELHEVKAMWSTGRGGWEDDARVKWKVAAETYPWFRFVAAHFDKRIGAWKREERVTAEEG